MPPTRKVRRVSGAGDGMSTGEILLEDEGTVEIPEIAGLVAPEVATRIQSVERRIEDLLQRFNQVSDDAARAIGKGVQLTGELGTLKVAFDENAEILEAIEKDVSDLRGREGGLDGQALEQLTALRAALEARVEAVEGAQKRADETHAEAVKKISSSAAALTETQKEQAEALAARLEAAQNERAQALEARLEAAQKEQAQALEARFADVKGSADDGDLRAELQQLGARFDGELALARETVEKVDDTLTAANGALERAQTAVSQVEGVEEKLAPLLAKFEESARLVEESRSRIDLAMRLVDDVESKIRRLIAPVDDAIEQVEAFEAVTVDGDLGFELHDLLQVMIKHNASDLHLKVGSPPTVRLDGELIPVGNDILSDKDCKRLIFGALSRSQRRRLIELKELDVAYAIPEARFRVNAFLSQGAVHAAFRLLRTEMPSIEELHLPAVLKQLATMHSGLVLVTGPAGSGKSTTLAAMIDYVNTTLKKHVITLEDPIEFLHRDKQSIVTQREIGTDTASFREGLRQALRQDPNIVLIGEMRDAETIMTAVVAAETGHLVLSTLHTQNAVQAVDRMLDVFHGEQQRQFRLLLSNTLRGVVSQRLLQRADQQGRVAAVEVLVNTPTIASLILEGKTNDIYAYLQQGATEGMQTFTASLTRLLEQGLITKEEALYHADQPTELRLEVDGHTSGSAQYSEGDTLMNWL